MTDNEWPLEADFSDIRPMTPEERKASLERDERTSGVSVSVVVMKVGTHGVASVWRKND